MGVIILVGLLMVEGFTFAESSIFANIGHKTQQYSKFVRENYNNEPLLKEFTANHPANQHRSIYAGSKIDAYLKLIDYYLANLQGQKCINTAEAAIKFWDQYYYFYQLLGDCYLAKGDQDNAFEVYKKAWQIKPNSKSLTDSLVTLANIQNRPEEAAEFQRIYSIYPKSTAEIQVVLSDESATTPGLRGSTFSDIPINGRFVDLARPTSKESIKDQSYLHILFKEHAGLGSTMAIESITLTFDQADSVVLDQFTDWGLQGLEPTVDFGEFNQFNFNDFEATLTSPKLNFDQPIKNIKIKIKYDLYEE